MQEDASLMLKGRYATTPRRFLFRYRFAREGSDWKLVWVNISTQSVTAG